MRLLFLTIVGVLGFGQVSAHEMTPTYFEINSSYIDKVVTTQIKLFNRREDVRYYEITVFDEEWNPLPFAAVDKIVKIDYLGRATLDLYFKESDANDIGYICTTSKIVKGEIESSLISSRICSKRKEKE